MLNQYSQYMIGQLGYTAWIDIHGRQILKLCSSVEGAAVSGFFAQKRQDLTRMGQFKPPKQTSTEHGQSLRTYD